MNALRISALAVVLAFTGCNCASVVPGSGTTKVEDRTVGPFHRVEVADGLQLRLTDRPWDSVSISADDNVINYIYTEVKDGVLKVGTWQGTLLDSTTPVVIDVSVQTLNELGASGGAKITSGDNGGIQCDRVAIQATGGATIELSSVHSTDLVIWPSGGSHVTLADVQSPKASFSVSGGSELTLSKGSIDAYDAEVSGGSTLTAGDAAAQSVTLNVSGGSHATVNASQSVGGSISGGSTVNVKGNPAERTMAAGPDSNVKYE